MKRLLVISSAPATFIDGKPYLDRKFCDGIRFYAEAWDGPVAAILFRRDERMPFSQSYEPSDLPFEFSLLEGDAEISASDLVGADLVLASGDNHRLLDLPGLRAGPAPAIVYTIEYTPETRRQILLLERDSGWARKAYALAWTHRQERRRRAAFRASDGLQANGYPAMAEYAPLNGDALLYLDNRIGRALLVTEAERTARRERLRSGGPLRILHSGRLEPLKGAQDLVPIAKRLADRGVAFRMDIFGAGSLADPIREEAGALGLSDRVRLNAPVDFDTELVPYARREADLYLSCHRQSDPSCTYLESMGCGLPIAGYANRMLGALAADSDAAWTVPLGDWKALADRIADIAERRDEIAAKAEKAADFAGKHLFEDEFAARIAHLEAVASRTAPRGA